MKWSDEIGLPLGAARSHLHEPSMCFLGQWLGGAIPSRSSLAAIVFAFGFINMPASAEVLDATASDLEATSGSMLGSDVLTYSVILNGQDGEALVDLRYDREGRVLARRTDLEFAGLDIRQRSAWIDLGILRGVAYDLDEANLQLRLEAAPSALRPTLYGPTRPGLPHADDATGALLNYDVEVELPLEKSKEANLAIGIEGRVFSRLGLLESHAIATRYAGSGGRVRYRRLGTRFTRTLLSQSISLSFGHVATSSESWSRALRLGGISIRRDFGLRPDRMPYGALGIEGTAIVPGRVDLLLGDRSVYGVDVGAGVYRLSDIPVGLGPSTAYVRLETSDGQVLRREIPVYGAAELLRPGVIDFNATLGKPRLNYGLDDSRYVGGLVGQASIRRGITRHLTFGAGLEAAESYRQAHLAIATAPWARFLVSARAGASLIGGRTGQFAEAAISVPVGNIASLDGHIFRATDSFASLADAVTRAEAGPDVLDEAYEYETFSASLRPREGSHRFGLGYAASRYDGQSARRASFGYGYTPHRGRASVAFNASRNFEREETRLALNISFKTGKTGHSIRSDSRGEIDYYVSRADRGTRDRWDWQGRLNRDGDGGLQVSRETQVGRVAASVESFGERTRLGLGMRGSLAVVGANFAAGPYIPDAFALVKTNQRNLPVRLQNREIGRTGPSGQLVVAPLNAYSTNRISIDPDDIPEGMWSNATGVDVVPRPGAGVLVDFSLAGEDDARHFRIVDGSGTPLALGTEVRVGRHPGSYLIGYDGEVLIENASAGDRIFAPDCSTLVPGDDKEADVIIDLVCS